MAVCCACLLLPGAGSAAADGVDFRDDFGTFDEGRWSEGDHTLGRSYLDPANVDVDGQNLRIRLPARSLNGGEISTRELYGYGSYAVRMRVPNAPSSVTGFFLYRAPDYESEIDIEVFNDSTRRVMFTTYAGGRQTHTETMKLPFDPTSGFHEYRFDYSGDSVTFLVDGVEMRTWETGVPQASMHLMVNSWFPAWLEGRRPKRPCTPLWTGYPTRPRRWSTDARSVGFGPRSPDVAKGWSSPNFAPGFCGWQHAWWWNELPRFGAQAGAQEEVP